MAEGGEKILEARLHPSGFEMSDSNFYSLTCASDSRLYYTLCSHDINTHARVYRYDPQTDEVTLIADLGEVTGEAGKKSLPQGKSHTPFFEHDGKLYFASHYGYFKASGGKEEPAEVPEGYTQYPGGHFIEIEMRTGRARVLGTAQNAEGIITMTLDGHRGRLYGLTWPRGYFIFLDLDTGRMTNLGPVSRDGEVGTGDRYFCLCRTFALFQETGDVYFTNPDGEILCYVYSRNRVERVDWAHMRKDVFGFWDPHTPGHQGYNWRPCKWHPGHQVFYGVHPKSGYLFLFDPKKKRHEMIDRICSERIRKAGLFEYFRYGYLTLDFAPDDPETVCYISGYYAYRDDVELTDEDRLHGLTCGSADFSPGAFKKIRSFITFVTYHLPTRTYTDHGVVRLEDGRFPTNTQTIAVHPNGRVYTCPWLPRLHRQEGKPWSHCELISFRLPHTGGAL